MTTSLPFFKRIIKFILRFLEDPFGTLDSLDLTLQFKNRNPKKKPIKFQFNMLRNDKLLSKALLEIFVLIPLLCWILLGSDSTIEQVTRLMSNIPQLLLGNISFNQWINIYGSYYGLGTHWSASVIYGLLFVGVSKWLREHLEIYNSQNLCITTGFVGLAIGTFEFFWMSSYYFFQKQSWILSPQFPQLRIILQTLLFITPGIIVLLGMDRKTFQLNLDKRTILFFFFTLFFVLLWYNYPFPIDQLTVEVEGFGTWISSRNFAQTMYTVDLNITDNMAIGEMFFMDNPGIHFVNNMCKIFWTLTIYNLSNIKVKKILKNGE